MPQDYTVPETTGESVPSNSAPLPGPTPPVGEEAASTKEGAAALRVVDRAVPLVHNKEILELEGLDLQDGHRNGNGAGTPDLQGFLPGDAPKNGAKTPLEEPCPAEEFRPAEGPGTTPQAPASPSPTPDSSPPNPLSYNSHATAITATLEPVPQQTAGKRVRKTQEERDLERHRKLLPSALDYLAQAQAGKDDFKFLGVGQCLKATGHDFQEWDEWAAKAGCTCPDRQTQWNSFNAADQDYTAIIGMAVNAGWEKPGKGGPKSERVLSIEEMAARGWQITGGTSPALIHNSVVNAKLGLEETGWAERIRLNGWTGTLELDGKPKDITDFEDLARYHLEAAHTSVGFRPASIHVRTGIRVIAEHRGYNPTLSAIDQETWDEVDRYPLLARLLVGPGKSAADRELDNAIAALIVRGMVVRALEPGSTVGYAPVLRSKREGAGKGKTIGVLAPGGHSVGGEFAGGNWQKDLRDKLRNVSALEIAEHAALPPRAEANMRGFITSLVMNERSSYAAKAIPENVRAMLFITTNRRHFLNGVEHRRFPVLAIPNGHSIDLAAVNAIKHQLWAQAAWEYRQGHFRNVLGETEVTLPEKLWAAANDRSKEYEAVSTTKDLLVSIIGDRTELDAGDFQRELSGTPGRRISNQEFGDAMEDLGWVQKRVGKARDAIWFLEE